MKKKTKWQNFIFRLYKSKYISHHSVHDQKFENNTIATVLGKAAMYDKVNIEATVSHVSNIGYHE